jgi:hypothetical protein
MGGSPARVIQNIIKPKAPTPAPMAVAPTTAEISQATSTSMDGYDSRKTKAKGRSMTILTSPYGVEDKTATLGRLSLLGQ